MLTPEQDTTSSSLKRQVGMKDSSPDDHATKKVKPSEPEKPENAETRKLEKDQKEADRKLEKEKKDAEKKALREKKEAERKAEKERKEAERQVEKLQKEAERKAEKERKEAERKEEKEKKEAEKQAEKIKKEAEKQAEKEKKEAEKQAAKERKDKEKLRAQPKINLFFKSSSTQSTPSSGALLDTSGPSGSATSSQDTPAPSASEPLTDYQKQILPFHVKQNGQLFSGVCNYIYDSPESEMDPREWLVRQNKGTEKKPEDIKLTSHQFRTQLALAQESAQVASLLTRLRIRRLQFSHLSPKYIEEPAAPVNEEFRPPYVGSVLDIDSRTRHELATDPFRTDLVDSIAYEYDSEVEWDHEDGEDLRDDDGDDSDEDPEDPEELKEFLSSDEDDAGTSKRPKLIGPLTPVVIWGNIDTNEDLQPFSIELLRGPIDPYKKSEDEVITDGVKSETQIDSSEPCTLASMLSPLESKVGFDSLKSSLLMHNGSTGTKTLIIELLKQQFPMATAQEIRNVFDICMKRVGKKRTEKMWVLSSEAKQHFSLSDTLPQQPQQSQPLNVFQQFQQPQHNTSL